MSTWTVVKISSSVSKQEDIESEIQFEGPYCQGEVVITLGGKKIFIFLHDLQEALKRLS